MDQPRCSKCGVGPEGPDLAGNQGHRFDCPDHPDFALIQQRMSESNIEAASRLDKVIMYPVSAALRDAIFSAQQQLGMTAPPAAVTMIVEAVEAYEHGNAAVEDVNAGMTLQMYADVAADLALTILMQN